MKNRHVAYNLRTGEVIMTNNGNHLKRVVARNEAWDRRNGYGCGKWVFSHKGQKDLEKRLLTAR